MKKNIIRWMALALISAIFFACAPKLTDERVRQIKRGMSRFEVHRILGKPKEIGNAKMKDFGGVADFYEGENLSVTIIFKNNEVRMVFLNQEMLKLEEK